MVQDNKGIIFLVRMYRENGELIELLYKSVDLKTALFNLKKSYNKDFELIEDGENPVLEEIKL